MRSRLRLLVLIVILAIVLYPLLWMLGTSFKSPQEIASNIGLVPHHWTPGNFSQGWRKFDVDFGRFFLNSAMVAVLTVVGNVLSCLLAAYALGRLKFRLRGMWFAIMIGTLLLPAHVLIIPQYILFRTLGWVGGSWPYLPLLIPHFLATEAFFVFLMVQFMRGIPRELDEAASLDGCGPWRTYWRIVLPLCRPALVTTSIFSFIWTWNDFFPQLIYLNDTDKYTVPRGLSLFVDQTSAASYGPMMAMSMLAMVPVLLFFLAFQRLLVEH